MAADMSGLTIGRIVWVWHHGIGSRRPAVVTRVVDKEDGVIGAHVFLDAMDPPGIEINVRGEAGVYEYDEGDVPLTWHWPKRAD